MLKAGPCAKSRDTLGILFAPTFTNHRWPLTLWVLGALIPRAVENLQTTAGPSPPTLLTAYCWPEALLRTQSINTYFVCIIYCILRTKEPRKILRKSQGRENTLTAPYCIYREKSAHQWTWAISTHAVWGPLYTWINPRPKRQCKWGWKGTNG